MHHETPRHTLRKWWKIAFLRLAGNFYPIYNTDRTLPHQTTTFFYQSHVLSMQHFKNYKDVKKMGWWLAHFERYTFSLGRISQFTREMYNKRWGILWIKAQYSLAILWTIFKKDFSKCLPTLVLFLLLLIYFFTHLIQFRQKKQTYAWTFNYILNVKCWWFTVQYHYICINK